MRGKEWVRWWGAKKNEVCSCDSEHRNEMGIAFGEVLKNLHGVAKLVLFILSVDQSVQALTVIFTYVDGDGVSKDFRVKTLYRHFYTHASRLFTLEVNGLSGGRFTGPNSLTEALEALTDACGGNRTINRYTLPPDTVGGQMFSSDYQELRFRQMILQGEVDLTVDGIYRTDGPYTSITADLEKSVRRASEFDQWVRCLALYRIPSSY